MVLASWAGLMAVAGLVVRILSVSGHRIKRVRVIKQEPPPPGNGGNGGR
jgi:CBS domain containing-hemolysin-like protein